MKTQVVQTIKDVYGVNPLIKEKGSDEVQIEESKLQTNLSEGLSKDSFILMISLLEEAGESSELLMETGIDITLFESRFLEIIETLFSFVFNFKQLALIHKYIFGETYIKDIPVLFNDKGEQYEPETPEQLWEAISNLN